MSRLLAPRAAPRPGGCDPRLPARGLTAARARVPVRTELLGLCRGGDRAPRGDPRRPPRGSADRAVSSLGRLRLRPGALRWIATSCSRSRSRFVVLSVWTMMQPAPRPKPASAPQAEMPAPALAPGFAGSGGSRARAAEPAEQGSPPAPREVDSDHPPALPRGALERGRRAVGTGSSRGTGTGTAIRCGSWSRGDPLATAVTPFEELALGDLSKQMWRVESRSDTEVRFVWERRGVAIRKTYSFSDDGYDFRLRIDVSKQRRGADRAEVRRSAADPRATGQRLPRAGRDRARRAGSSASRRRSRASAGPSRFGRFMGKQPGESVFPTRARSTRRASQTPTSSAALLPEHRALRARRFTRPRPGKAGISRSASTGSRCRPRERDSRISRLLGPKESSGWTRRPRRGRNR